MGGRETPSSPNVMAFPDLAVNAIYTVLCLVPGFITVETVTYIANPHTELTEFQRSTWSFIASGVSLSVTYFIYTVWMAVVTGRFVLVRSVDVTWVDVVTLYPVLLVVAAAIGYLSAKVFVRTVGPTSTPHLEKAQ